MGYEKFIPPSENQNFHDSRQSNNDVLLAAVEIANLNKSKKQEFLIILLSRASANIGEKCIRDFFNRFYNYLVNNDLLAILNREDAF
jgi:hypothetical protein